MLSCSPWLPTRPPFRELRSGLRNVERYLNGDVLSGHGGWKRLNESLCCDAWASHAVTGMLRLADVRWQLERDQTAWRLSVASSVLGDGELEALVAVARLVEADGWRRLKRCAAAGCDRAFPDITNGSSAVMCLAHRRRRPVVVSAQHGLA